MSLAEKLYSLLEGLSSIYPELLLIAGACGLLLLQPFKTSITLLRIGVAVVLLSFFIPQVIIGISFYGQLVSDSFTKELSNYLVVFVIGILLYPKSEEESPTYYFLILIHLVGALLLLKVRNLLLIYLIIELLSYSAYLLTNFNLTKNAHEAGLKYLVFGGVSSAIMLFGISWLYGANQSLDILVIDGLFEKAGALLFLVGFLFKAGLVPLHIWLPDVYQASSPKTAVLFSFIPKVAALFALLNILKIFNWGNEWLVWVGVFTLVLGTFGAIKQQSIRRLISYGTFVHVAFLLALVLLSKTESFIFYSIIYGLMNLAVFLFIEMLEKNQIHELKHLNGMGGRNLLLAISATIILVALTGLPPTAGFTIKWLALTEMFSFQGLINQVSWLTFFISLIALTVVSLFYYLKIPYHLFLEKLEGQNELKYGSFQLIILFAISTFILLLFFYPSILIG